MGAMSLAAGGVRDRPRLAGGAAAASSFSAGAQFRCDSTFHQFWPACRPPSGRREPWDRRRRGDCTRFPREVRLWLAVCALITVCTDLDRTLFLLTVGRGPLF